MPRKKEAPKAAPKAVPKDEFSVQVQMGKFKVKETGSSIYDALSKLKLNKVIGRVNLTFSNGIKEHTMVFVKPLLFRRSLHNDNVRKIFEKRAKAFLGIK